MKNLSATTKNNAKNQIAKSSTKEIVKDENKAIITESVSTKKFVGIDYTKMDAKQQKRFRSEIRRKLFKIILDYSRLKLTKELNETNAKELFETFKTFVKEHYNIPLSDVQNVFKGQSNKSLDFANFIEDFKAYLQKSESKAKAKA